MNLAQFLQRYWLLEKRTGIRSWAVWRFFRNMGRHVPRKQQHIARHRKGKRILK